MKHHIFSYGSNLLLARIKARVPSVRFIGKAKLTGYQLRWHKLSKDRSGKCDAFNTGNQLDILWGGVFEIDTLEKPLLDKAEGLGVGYDETYQNVEITHSNGPLISMQTSLYTALQIDAAVKPYSWYKAFVVAGAHECGLPDYYLAQLKNTPSIQDSDVERDRKNRSLLPFHFRDV